MNDDQKFSVPIKLFELGNVVATRGALAATSHEYRIACLGRHVSGDWGCVCHEDRQANFDAVLHGERILSSYPLDAALPCKGWGDNTLWIITERDRSVTTFLLPSEY